jgi:pimeloyl-ACP methyl ester carboxylesterase
VDEPLHASSARGDLAFWELGDGAPVLCLHGFPDHAIGMLPLAGELAAAGFRCICPALPGYWPSAAVDDYGIPAVAKDLLDLCDALGLDRVALVGHDWGASIGYFLASEHPERLASFVALGTPHPAGFAIRRTAFAELETAWYAFFLAYGRQAAEIARQPRWLTALAQSWSPGLVRSDWDQVLELLGRPGVLEAVCAYYRADLDATLDQRPAIAPTTVIHGGQDGCIRPAAYHGAAAWFEGPFRLEFLPSAGHWPHLEEPESVGRLVVQGCWNRPPPVAARAAPSAS